jgi:hypothetical protein
LFPIEKNKDHFSRLVAEAKKDKTVPEEDKPTSPKGSIFIKKIILSKNFARKTGKISREKLEKLENFAGIPQIGLRNLKKTFMKNFQNFFLNFYIKKYFFEKFREKNWKN